MQAIILAAGMGKRLKELTRYQTKCMIQVNGEPLIKRMLEQLERKNLKKIVIVIGYKGKELVDYICTLGIQTPIEYVTNDIYNKTNNIYSLYLAKEYLLEDDTILLESDLIFQEELLDRLLSDPYPSLALVAKYESWMDGTVVTLDDENNITEFLGKKEFNFKEVSRYYKTVNMYKFSKIFSTTHYVPFLEAYSKALGNNEYYEQVLKVIALLDKPEIKASVLEGEIWYEIDDVLDLDVASSLFTTAKDKLSRLQDRYGGYWRYPKLIDFCYLVNPYYPPQKLMDEVKSNFESLVREYPSGSVVNNLLASNYFNINEEYIVIGNGAAELIKELITHLGGNMGIVFPTFDEYPNRKDKHKIVSYYPDNENMSYDSRDLIKFYEGKDIGSLLLINPDNPSGNYINKKEVIELAEWAKKKNITLVIDESFIDFVGKESSATILSDDILYNYPNVVIVKSISKSFGIPGFRLGVLASSNVELINVIKKNLSIWNINSFGEFYMQIAEKYKGDYEQAIEKFISTRSEYVDRLSKITKLRVIPSEANYIMCEITNGYSAKKLTEVLLDKYNILIKDLSTKRGFRGEYIRVAVKDRADNIKLINALEELLS